MAKLDDVQEQIDKGFKGLEAQQQKSQQAIDSEFEVLKRRISGVEGISGELKQTKEWITDVESKINTARTHGPESDNLKGAIPAEYRRHIEIATRHGYADPVNRTALCLWWHFQFMARKALREVTGKTAPEYMRMAEDLEKGWGYDPAQKALLGDALAGGGSIIATPVEAELMRLIQDNTVVRPLATKIVMNSLTLSIPVENANVSAFIVAENATVTDALPATAFASRVMTARKFGGMATVTNENLQDNIIGLNNYLFNSIAEQIGRLEDTGALEGGIISVQNFSGVKYAAGVNNYTCAITTGTGGSVPNYNDLVSIIYAGLQAGTRTGSQFFMNPVVFKNIVGLTDTTGQPVFSFGSVPNAIPHFVGGYPVHLVSSLSTQWTNGSAGSSAGGMYFGPASKIIYGDSTGMNFDIDPYFFFDTVKTRIRVLKRTGIIVPVGGYFTVGNGARMV